MESGSKPTAGLLSYLSLGAIYVIWSTTFLAMRIGVREGSGFAPWIFGGTRVLAAGILLLAIAWLAGRTLKVSRAKLWTLIISGNLVWVGGHGFLLWAEQWAASGYTGLFIAAFPILAAVYDALLDRRLPAIPVIVGLFLGFAGMLVLMAPELGDAGTLTPLVLVALAAAPIAFAAGFTLQRRRATGIPALTAAAIQHLAAAPAFFLMSWWTAEPAINAGPEVWWAWVYLIVFGSIVAYAAAVHALNTLPPRIAMTYGFVNPVLAVVFGHLVLNEVLGSTLVLGAALVLLGVYLVFRERTMPSTPQPISRPE